METKTKRCIKCGRELPLDAFYQHKAMKDGYQNECKECSKERFRQYRKKKKKKLKDAILDANKVKLSDFSPRDMMHELAKRGYYGIVHFDTEVEKEIEVDGHKGIFRYKETQNIDITNF